MDGHDYIYSHILFYSHILLYIYPCRSARAHAEQAVATKDPGKHTGNVIDINVNTL